MRRIISQITLLILFSFLLIHSSIIYGAEPKIDDDPFCKIEEKDCPKEKNDPSPSSIAKGGIKGGDIVRIAQSKKIPDINKSGKNTDRNPGNLKTTISSLQEISAIGPNDAPVTIIGFSDFESQSGAKAASAIRELLETYEDKIRFIFKHTPLPIHANAMSAHEAALAAGEQGKFWEMHDLIFANQQQLEEDDLSQYAKQINLDMKRFNQALKEHTFRPIIERDLIDSRGFGVTIMPTFFINGRKLVGERNIKEFKAIIDKELGLNEEATEQREERENTDTITPEKIKIDHSPVKGLPTAPVTIVEFSDFQCPFCARTVSAVKEILKEYPDQVKWVFKHYPLDFHANSPLAHEAALAAGEQGKFWEMHDLIFANQNKMERDGLIQFSKQIGLDTDQFIKDLDSRRFKSVVDADKEEGELLGVSGTPTFFINGKKVVGVRSITEFKKVIDAELIKSGIEIKKSDNEKNQVNSKSINVRKSSVKITWFTDLQNSQTNKASRLMQEIMDIYPDNLQSIMKYNPSDNGDDHILTHEAALAAGDQGKFWEMQGLISTNQGSLKRDDLIAYAGRIGLNQENFIASLDGHKYRATIEKDMEESKRLDVSETPAFFINGKRIDGIQPISVFKEMIDKALE